MVGAIMQKLHSIPLLMPYNNATETGKARPKWRTSLLLLVGLAAAVLITNTAFLVWAISTRGTRNGTGTLYEASCDEMRKVNTGIHVLINILSTMLLGGSNYCMQCLSAPSRPEVDAAHAQGRYLDIGVPSLHNVLASPLSFKKKMCWWILAASSFPLHLCYNSAVFATLSAQTYGAWQLGFEAKTALENGTYFRHTPEKNLSLEVATLLSAYEPALEKKRLERLDVLSCINEYSQPLQASRGNVFLVTQNSSVSYNDIKLYSNVVDISSADTGGHQYCRDPDLGTQWIYSQFTIFPNGDHGWVGDCVPRAYDTLLSQLKSNPYSWTPFWSTIDYCLSERTEQQCTLNFSIHIGIIVILCNALKLVVMLCSAMTLRHNPLLTIGDAVSSFLQEPDHGTLKMCLESQKTVHTQFKAQRRIPQPASPYRRVKPWWMSSVKHGKATMCVLALSAGVFVLLGLFIWRYRAIQSARSLGDVLGIGLGRIDPRTVIAFIPSENEWPFKGVPGILANVFLANSPQVIISLIYFSYNATITSMLLAREWSSYFSEAKGLRVSTNESGVQRSTYFLQLPYRYAIPLLIFSCVLHWLASQSIFVVAVEVYNMHGNHNTTGQCYHWGSEPIAYSATTYVGQPRSQTDAGYCGADFITCGYSPLGIFISLIVACVLVLFLVILGLKRLNPMPVVGSCSIAIAASCHARLREDVPWEKPVRWGAFETSLEHGDVGHCGLSSEQVYRPVNGSMYA